MKTVNEIKEAFSDWGRENIGTDDLIVTMVDALIGITEHLEALKPTPSARRATECDVCAYQANTQRAATVVRREAMIEALRWADELTSRQYPEFETAIDRLENGGDL